MSDQDTNIFKEGDDKSTQTTQSPAGDDKTKPTFQLPDSLAAMVGEGKKYATVEAALASVAPAQEHISRLEEEMRTVKEQLAKAKTMEELLQQMKAQSTNTQQTTETQKGISAEDVAKLVEQTITKRERANTQQTNLNNVSKKIIEEMGGDKSKAWEFYQKRAGELGMRVEELNSLGATSPTALFTLLGLNKKDNSASRSTGGVNTEAVKQTTKQDEEKVNIMYGAKKEDILTAWRRAGASVQANNQ